MRPHRVFISYSHVDELYKDELITHMATLARAGRVEIWTDRGMTPSVHLRKEIDDAMSRTDLFLLLVSADWFASEFIYNVEMKVALDRHKAGISVALPVIIRPCSWLSTDIASLLAVPRDGKPVSTWGESREIEDWEDKKSVLDEIARTGRDAAWCDVVEGIMKILGELPTRLRPPSASPKEDDVERRFPEPFSRLG